MTHVATTQDRGPPFGAERIPAPGAPARYLGAAPVLFFWGLAVALSPFFVLGPGLPQISHGLLAGMIALMITTAFVPLKLDHTLVLIGGAWLAYVTVVNLTWYGITGARDDQFLLSTIYYAFNFAVMICVASLATTEADRFRRLTRWAILVAVGTQMAAVALDGGIRTTGTFENPNKLSYWALLLSACWFAVKPRGERLGWLDGGLMTAALMICFAAGSRAGIFGVAALLAVPVWYHGIVRKLMPPAILVAACGVLVAVAMSETWLGQLTESTTVTRFGNESKHDSFAGRGYDRLWLFPEYTLLGAGEGGYGRFVTLSKDTPREIQAIEIHSTFANILFSYGLVGMVFFALMLWWVFRRQHDWRFLGLFAPMAVYGMAHQGLRATELWAFLGIVLSVRWRQSR